MKYTVEELAEQFVNNEFDPADIDTTNTMLLGDIHIEIETRFGEVAAEQWFNCAIRVMG